ncbi:Mitogen-activated protein kinase like MMK1 [Tripterygium wilfordii]|uniref:Mitogen-activated protein kinase like MMK1 n=1 Tax=Tripterygium wilfordii TaxID=458696 RepID=A0A7J7D900_TRIWF|nr:Mitogen-activated protein kinase like MMK1 [Tripterygium wilfordii]
MEGQPPDTEMAEVTQPPQQHQQQPAMGVGIENIPATLSHGGRFIQYNIFGNIFEVTAKYKPPIMPIGKGAYGLFYALSELSRPVKFVICRHRYILYFSLWLLRPEV